jgi:hypothetical protein
LIPFLRKGGTFFTKHKNETHVVGAKTIFFSVLFTALAATVLACSHLFGCTKGIKVS